MVQAGGISDMYWHFSGPFSMCFHKYKSFTARLGINWGNQWLTAKAIQRNAVCSAWKKMELQFEHPCHLISLCCVQRGFTNFSMGFCSTLTQDNTCILAALWRAVYVIPVCSRSWKVNVFSTWNTTPCYCLFVSQCSCWSPLFSYHNCSIKKESVLLIFFICSAVYYDATFNHWFPAQQTSNIGGCIWHPSSHPKFFREVEAFSVQCTECRNSCSSMCECWSLRHTQKSALVQETT